MSRFDYVKYNDRAVMQQDLAKELCKKLESMIESLDAPRSKALALTKLEECYMWIGKAVRDDQIVRSGPAALQEDRKDG